MGVLMVIGAFSAVMYTSCSKTKDACSGITCLNGGACSNGTCTCRTGFGDSVCSTQLRTIYSGGSGTYRGNGTDNGALTFSNYTATFINPGDTNYVGLTLTTKFSDGNVHFTAPIVLSNMSLTGTATFTITSTVYAGNTYAGSGTVSPTSATLSFSEDTTGLHTTYTFASMSKI